MREPLLLSFLKNRNNSRPMAMERKTQGGFLAMESAGTSRNEAVRVVRHRFRATAAAYGARARGSPIHGDGGGPARTERHER